MMWIATLFWLFVLACLVRWAASAWRTPPALQPTYQAELVRLRDEVDQLTAQVVRLSDEQQFLMRLLAEGQRPASGPPLPPPPQPENREDGDERGR